VLSWMAFFTMFMAALLLVSPNVKRTLCFCAAPSFLAWTTVLTRLWCQWQSRLTTRERDYYFPRLTIGVFVAPLAMACIFMLLTWLAKEHSKYLLLQACQIVFLACWYQWRLFYVPPEYVPTAMLAGLGTNFFAGLVGLLVPEAVAKDLYWLPWAFLIVSLALWHQWQTPTSLETLVEISVAASLAWHLIFQGIHSATVLATHTGIFPPGSLEDFIYWSPPVQRITWFATTAVILCTQVHIRAPVRTLFEIQFVNELAIIAGKLAADHMTKLLVHVDIFKLEFIEAVKFRQNLVAWLIWVAGMLLWYCWHSTRQPTFKHLMSTPMASDPPTAIRLTTTCPAATRPATTTPAPSRP
jgi:hypothetical protein